MLMNKSVAGWIESKHNCHTYKLNVSNIYCINNIIDA